MNLVEDILNTKKPNQEYPMYYHERDVIEVAHEFASQFKEWIPVIEKLPENGKDVICFATGFQYYVNYFNGEWVSENNGYKVKGVTHFHYLLPNPK